MKIRLLEEYDVARDRIRYVLERRQGWLGTWSTIDIYSVKSDAMEVYRRFVESRGEYSVCKTLQEATL